MLSTLQSQCLQNNVFTHGILTNTDEGKLLSPAEHVIPALGKLRRGMGINARSVWVTEWDPGSKHQKQNYKQTVTNIFSRRRVWGKAGWGAFLKAMLLSSHVGDIPVSYSGKIWKKALWHTRAVPACLWCQSEVEMLVITLCSQRAWDGYTAQRLAHRALFLLESQRTTCGCWFFLPCGSRDYT